MSEENQTKGRTTLTVTLDTGEVKTIVAEKYTRILGCNLLHNLTWQSHLQSGKKPLLGDLRRKLGTLKYLSHQMPHKCRKILAEGIIWSKVTYLIEVWGGAPLRYLKKLQVILNNTARFVTGDGRRTAKSTLLEKCKWLSIEETITLYTGVRMWNVLRRRIPKNLTSKIVLNEDSSVSTTPARLITTSRSFRWHGTELWNNLSTELRENLSLPSFKRNLRKWIIENINDDSEYRVQVSKSQKVHTHDTESRVQVHTDDTES